MLFAVYIVLIYNICFLYAADTEVSIPVQNNFSIGSSDSVTITGTGYVDGNITPTANNVGTVNINTDYNTVKTSGSTTYQTNLGTSSNYIGTVNINGTSSNMVSARISNDAYINNLNISNANLIINVGSGVNINNITKSNGATANIGVDYDFGNGTVFGTSSSSIDNLTINNSAVLTINKDVYITNLKLSDDASSSLNLEDGAKVYGTITSGTNGSGTININSSYNNGTNTVFGTNSNSIGTLNINSGVLSLNNTAYINLTNIASGASLELNSSSSLIGSVSGSGSVDINRNYTATSENTKFGVDDANRLSTLNVTGNNKLTLSNGNVAYVDNLNLLSANSTLTIKSNSGVNGTISGDAGGAGVVNIERNYNTSNTEDVANYFDTTFGTETNSLNTLNVNGSNSLTLGGLAYVNNVRLASSKSVLNLENEGAVAGTVSGNGSVSILRDYTTSADTTNAGEGVYQTNFGASASSRIATINLGQNSSGLVPEIAATLALNNNAYVGSLNISDMSTLIINEDGGVNGTIRAIGDGQGIVEIHKKYNTSLENTVFGTDTHRLSEVNILNNNADYDFTLTNSAYIDNLRINASAMSYTDTARLITMTSGAQLNGSITLDKGENDALLGVVLDGEGVLDLSDLLSLVNTGKSGTASVSSGNEVFLNLVDRGQLIEGSKILLDSGKDYTNAALTYDGIFLNLKLDKSIENQLNLDVEANRSLSLDDVSAATMISANRIDSWTFDTKSTNENVLTLNLQSIDSREKFTHALISLTPDVSGLNVKIPTQSIMSAVANINKRLNFLRTVRISEKSDAFMQKLLKNMPSYYDEYAKKRNMWWEFFGGTLHQDTTDNIFGYDADYYGATVGYDFKVNRNFVLGGSYTFSYIDANDLDYIKKDRDDMEAITNNLGLYLMLYNKWNYLALNVGGGYNMYNQKRKINFSDFNMVAKADYNGFSYHGDVEYGVNLVLYGGNTRRSRIKAINERTGKVDELERIGTQLQSYNNTEFSNFLLLTPKVSLTYNNIMIDKYTEKGADAANLIIKTKDYESLDLNAGLSLTLSKAINTNTSFQTILNGYVSYALLNNKVELDARYIDDNKTFKVYGFEPNELTYNTGISFNFNFYDKIDLGLGCNYTFGDGVEGVMFKLSILYNF